MLLVRSNAASCRSADQILLINLPTDFPEMTIPVVNADLELVQAPHRWDIGFIRRFMIMFGLSHKPVALFAKNIHLRHQ
jgi:hypothetical protein